MPTKAEQPIAAAQIPDAHLKLSTVVAVTGLSETSLRRLMGADKFPHPIRQGTRCPRWRAGSVTAWLKAQEA